MSKSALPAPAVPRKTRVTIRRARLPATAAAKPRGEPNAATDATFLPSALEVLDAPASPLRIIVLAAVAGLFAVALAWSYFGRLAVYAEAPGRINAAGRTKVVEPTQRGQVAAIHVKNGDQVSRGEVLVELDPTDARAARTIIADKLASVRADIARKEAEIAAARADLVDQNPKVAWDPKLPTNVRDREQRLLRAELSQLAATLADLQAQRDAKITARDKFADSVAAQRALISVISQSVAIHQQLERSGWDSEAKLLAVTATLKAAETTLATLEGSLADAAAAIPVLDGEIAKTREQFVASATQGVGKAQRQADDLAQQLTKATRTLDEMTLRAPLSGTVEATAVTTVGQVVEPGQQLMQIVPSGARLEIEAYVLNTDRGFIRPGQPAEIKVDTFPYGTYGSIPGTVIRVASDALQGDMKDRLQTAALDGALAQTTAAQKTAGLVFPIVVTAARMSMTVGGKQIPLVPGMTVQVDLKTEERRAIDYVVSPLVALFSTAGHER